MYRHNRFISNMSKLLNRHKTNEVRVHVRFIEKVKLSFV